ncbi:hypothetical protein MNBD_GAMMA21-2260 [hydrothermal vent metagenome]|uniref:MSHA biogenesis protein MshI n=1 Tax=hydrothermal vent metagenome TaxID=652676 RepID=A0A3B1AEB6_9ZZZZ
MQQVNLLQSSFRSTHHRWTVQHAGYLMVASVAVLTVITIIQWWLLSNKEDEVLFSQKNKGDILISIKKISAEISRISDDSELKKKLVTKEAELANKNNILHVLSGQRFGNTKGFASHLAGLSRQHVEGMWLTNLSIHHGGKKLNLQGSTFSPEHVPRYILNLSNEPSFEGVEFKTFLLERNIENNRIDFDIRSSQKETG